MMDPYEKHNAAKTQYAYKNACNSFWLCSYPSVCLSRQLQGKVAYEGCVIHWAADPKLALLEVYLSVLSLYLRAGRSRDSQHFLRNSVSYCASSASGENMSYFQDASEHALISCWCSKAKLECQVTTINSQQSIWSSFAAVSVPLNQAVEVGNRRLKRHLKGQNRGGWARLGQGLCFIALARSMKEQLTLPWITT